MSAILNEVKHAQQIIQSGELGKNTASTLSLLARYYRQKEQLNAKQTAAKLNDFMQANYKNYNPVLWVDTIEDISRKAARRTLKELDFIGITQSELDKIANLQNIKYEKILFTMLCYAKMYNAISPNNNGWINTGIPEIYRTARVMVRYRNDKFLYLNDIESTGLISFTKRTDNLNIKINFIDSDGEPVLKIDDFRELGYEYMNYVGEGRFIRCQVCSRLVMKKSSYDHSTKYCSECAKKTANEKRMQSMRALRNRDLLQKPHSPATPLNSCI